MNISSLLVLTAFLGTASCDSYCLRLSVDKCLMLQTYNRQNPTCSEYDKVDPCLGLVPQKCGVESDLLVQDVHNTYTETCTKHTEMNRLYKMHKECIFYHSADEIHHCMAQAMEEVYDLKNKTLTDFVETAKIACKHLDSITECGLEVIKKVCGPEAAEFRWRFQKPSILLTKRSCEYLRNESTGIESNVTEIIDDFVTTIPPSDSTSSVTLEFPKFLLATTRPPNLQETLSSAHAIEPQNAILILTVVFLLKYCLQIYT